MYRIGVDLGGTNISVGVVDADFNIIGRGKMKTNAPRDAKAIFDDIATAIKMPIITTTIINSTSEKPFLLSNFLILITLFAGI